LLLLAVARVTYADVPLGVLFDFQDGTVQGWSGGTVSNQMNTGPGGLGDHSLQLSNGIAGNFAMFNTGINGVIDPAISAITSDIFRPAGAGSGEIRLVLFDINGNRWTSTTSALIIDDGDWHNYVFSIREADLTHVLGGDTYNFLVNNLERIMFRHNPGLPSANGSPLPGTMNFDNITAIPEPTGLLVLTIFSFAMFCVRRRS
jgi:hypothetical protein